MEDICDNLFNPDPYYQQGGDMVRIGGMDYACTPAEAHRTADFRHDARRRHARGGRQELQGRRLGLGQSQNGKPVRTSLPITCAPRSREPGRPIGSRSKASTTIRALPREADRDPHRTRPPSVRGCAASSRARGRAARCAAGGPGAVAASADKPFAEHRLALQLSDDDAKKQGLVISVANNLLKFYGPDKIAIEVVGLRAGH